MRRAELSDLQDEVFDLVVIGGGITGVATARDAALRGLSVVVVERDDFAAGTSSRSTKLIHGGLRYLQTYQFAMVAESLRERERALRIAPHLTDQRPFLYLLHEGDPETRRLLQLGLTFYDVASGAWRRHRHQMLTAGQVLAREPHLARAGLLGAGLFHDVLTDDARYTLATASSAAQAGAQLVNHAEVVGLLLEKDRAAGVRVCNRLATAGQGADFTVRARQVVNATGPWTEATRRFEMADTPSRLRPSKGVHIVLRRDDFPLGTALFTRSPDDGRVVWPIPSLDHDVVYIGTTDTDHHGSPDKVEPTDDDVDYLLNVANHAIPEARVTRHHVIGSWAGLRPLVAPPPGTSTGNTSREHAIDTGPTGMITISGGKLTTGRLMAEQLVDAVQRANGSRPGRSRTRSLPLAGGSVNEAAAAFDAALSAGVPRTLATRWHRRYGSQARGVLERWNVDTSCREVIGPGELTRAEVAYLVDEEMAATLEDLMVRRVSLFFWTADGGLDSVEAIAEEMGARLDWDADRRAAEIAGYTLLVNRHRFTQ